MNKWIKKNDKVLILAGNDKGKTGMVLARSEDRIVVQGINVRKKHVKKTQKTQTAQIIDMEMPVHISNVAICDDDGAILKLKVKHHKNEKQLVYSKNSKEVIFRTLKKHVGKK